MQAVLEVIGTSLHDSALAASPWHARASALHDCCGRCSQHWSVAQLNVDGKSPSDPQPSANVSRTDELPRVLSLGPSACPTFAAVLLHDVLPDLCPGNVSAARSRSGPSACPCFAAVLLHASAGPFARKCLHGTLARHTHQGDDGLQHMLVNPHAHMYAAYSPAFSLHLSSVFKL